ncbi:MAG: sortase [Anaerolineae bacterium]
MAMRDRRCIGDLTTDELEHELLLRRHEERLERVRRVGALKAVDAALLPEVAMAYEPSLQGLGERAAAPSPFAAWRERILLAIEVAALVGLIVVVAGFAFNVRRINRDWKEQHAAVPGPTPTATALIRPSILPGGHEPPLSQGGEAEPISTMPRVGIPAQGPRSPTRIVISAIDIDVPVVEGVDWEQLKQGAGHLVGSANPGERGNCFIAGHNDIYGEIFRDLEELKIGDEILVYAGQQSFRYVVRATRIVEPDDVSVMEPTSTPVLTLLTCYPYMIDSHRLIVIAELDV